MCRGSHHEAVLTIDTVTTALPFIIGWLTSANLFDGYGKTARGWEAVPAGFKAVQCWAVGIPLGLVIR